MNKTINVSLPQGLLDMAKDKVKSGQYSSVSEVIRDALRSFGSSPAYPTIKLSEKANMQLKEAEAEYKAGNTTTVSSFAELSQIIDDEDNSKQ